MTTALPDVMNMSGTDNPVIVEDMLARGKLISVDQSRELLRATEPLAFVDFETGSAVRFRVEEAWNTDLDGHHGTDPVDAWMSISHGQNDGVEYQLSKDAMLEATTMCGLGKSYVGRAPGFLTQDALNFWYRGGLERDCRLMMVGENQLGAAITRGTVQPFSNLDLLDRALDSIRTRHPEIPIYVDATKFTHSLRKTFLQLVIPDLGREMVDTGDPRDNWWGGVQVSNSQTAEIQTGISGFLYRILCTNGMIDLGPTSNSWSRRSGGQNQEDVYAWAQEAVDSVLGGLEHSFDQIQALAAMPLEGEVGAAARDIFEQHRVPQRARERIINQLVEEDNLTMYGLMNAITAAANGDVRPEEAQLLMSTGGELVRHADRCDSCHRILPEGLVPAAE